MKKEDVVMEEAGEIRSQEAGNAYLDETTLLKKKTTSHTAPPLLENPDPETTEEIYVHKVYNDIANHFSQTRYKRWPIVENFLNSRPKGSIGLDIGCGNGKYLGTNKDIVIIGSDRSENLVQCAFDKNHQNSYCDVLISDGLVLPHHKNRFDFAISIAVIHHFSTKERRIEAVKTILNSLNEKGEALIYVWALEQKNSRRGWTKGMPKDVLVPWVKPDFDKKFRYYHLYEEGELASDVKVAGGELVNSGNERDNWWVVMKK